ncbi:CoA transferase [Tsuneonella sp. HG222]
MSLLAGHRVAALGAMAERPLARFLASLGAEIGGPVEGASFVIADQVREAFDTLAVDPQTICVSVTPFGSGGPRSGWRGSELVASAMGGTLRVTGEPDREPVKEAGDACTFHADMVAAAGAMAAHHARGRHGQGQHVDVSIQQVAFSRNTNGVLVWQFDRGKPHRVGGGKLAYGKAVIKAIWQLADGWCFHSLMTGRLGAPANQALSDWMDEVMPDNPLRGVDWLSYNRSTLPADTRAQWEAAIAAFFLTRTKRDIAIEGLRRGINACVVNQPDDVLADAHLAEREFFATEDGLPTRFAAIRPGDGASPSATQPGPRTGPLSGVRVLDFAWALVGSITTKTLGDLGADVVKIESRNRPDLARLDVQVAASKHGEFDDKPWFAHLNSSKRSVTLDLKKADAWKLLRPLIEWADVVVENFSPGTMAKLGLGFDDLKAINPDIVMVSGSVYGQTGPLAQEWGVDGTGGALSGRTYLTGYEGGDPLIPGAVPYGDVIVPFVMAACAAAALEARRVTGQGCHVDASMYEICVQQMRPFLAQAKSGGHPERCGNAQDGIVWQDVLRASGEDRWVAITAAEEADLARLHELTGPDVAGWVAARSDKEAVRLLQDHGIAAGIVQDCADMIDDDAQLAGRGALVELDHPLLGPFGHIATPMLFSRDVPQPFRAPRMGEHVAEVAAEICGLDTETIEALAAEGIFK